MVKIQKHGEIVHIFLIFNRKIENGNIFHISLQHLMSIKQNRNTSGKLDELIPTKLPKLK